MAIQYILLVSRQGKIRLQMFYNNATPAVANQVAHQTVSTVLARSPRFCNFIEQKDSKIVFRRYASLFFIVAIDPADNELLALEAIQHYVEILDQYYGNVCELDIIFHFDQAYYVLNEVFIRGQLQETNKREVLRLVMEQDKAEQESQQATLSSITNKIRVPGM
ncbi:hypothetical protein WA158_004089 [Blastocystis sp. Blastoise]